jgi:hypothetical protein
MYHAEKNVTFNDFNKKNFSAPESRICRVLISTADELQASMAAFQASNVNTVRIQ